MLVPAFMVCMHIIGVNGSVRILKKPRVNSVKQLAHSKLQKLCGEARVQSFGFVFTIISASHMLCHAQDYGTH